ncbi:hypothetical protein K7432_002637 [Basidiobolus ranarum]|uniref:Chitin-binding type-4 domain-containing protein n=1 Tax=Basidiobolus ranarum TaxID=34480 RepID=A0ABR2W7P6_9FUNG
MEMKSPPARHSVFSKFYRNHDPDWDITSPLGGKRTFPCQGYKKGPIQGSYKAGQSIPVEIVGPNTHKGGHCQFSISYDDKKFVVIKDVMHTCLTKSGTKFSIKIPSLSPPSNNATLAWSWINAEGNREYYMNCADIRITGGKKDGHVKGPELLVANYKDYPTVGEFHFDWEDDGQEMFDKRKIITIRP